MPKGKLLFLFSGLLISCVIRSQQIDSVLSIYHDNFQQEKVYLHFDKSLYNTGDTVWYKAYIMAGEGLSDYSRNFYVDWYDGAGKLIKHTIDPVFQSSARGQFVVPANYSAESIHIKAYTRWMLNFDTAFLYTKDLPVTHDGRKAGGNTQPSLSTSLHVFPEGGDLVNGLSSNVAFMAVNQAGHPVTVRGAILGNNNELVDSFASVHDGMGVFALEPAVNQKYTLSWIDEYGTNHSTPLPVAKSSGIVIEAQSMNNKAVFAVKRTADAAANFKQLHVVASMHQQLIYSAAINLSNKKTAGGEIPTEPLQTGVMQITVFDAAWVPVAERVVFVNNGSHEFFPKVNVVAPRTGRRAKTEVEISAPDTLLSNFSVSVTDAGLVYDSTDNIFSQLLLQGDIKGRIYNAAYYLSGDADAKKANLDLIMLTHGWRRYKWEDIVKGRMPVLPYTSDSDYAQIKGRVMLNGRAPVSKNQTIAVIMQSRDSSKQYFMLPVAPDGIFNQRGLIFFDTARVYYQLSGDKKVSDAALVNFQYGLPLVPYATNMRVQRFADPDSLQLQNSNLFYAGVAKSRRSMDSAVVLKEVTVQSKIKSPVDILDEKYTTGLFNSKNGYAFDVMHDPRTAGQIDIFHYLQNLIPGLTMSLPVLGANGTEDANASNAPGLNWRDGTPDLFLNEMPTDATRLTQLQMTDIAYVKVFKPPFMAASGSGASGAIAVYTRKADDLRFELVKGMGSALLTGYTSYKEFYQPDYTQPQSKLPDNRATLYWNPYLLTDKRNRTVKIEFFNNDITHRFRIVLEGVNAAGKLARVEKIVE